MARLEGLTIGVMSVLMLASAHGQDIRMANGVLMKGDVVSTSKSGLDIQTATGVKTVTWDTVAPSSRYRHDPLFRANFKEILQGLPPSARVHPPLMPTPEIQAKPAAEKPAAAISASNQAPKSLLIYDRLAYATAPAFFANQFPASDGINPETAVFSGFQYGLSKTEAVYLAFDARGSQEARDTLVVYTPSNSVYSPPASMGGLKKNVGAIKIIAFKKFPLFMKSGDLSASFELECSTQSHLNEVSVVTYVELSSGEEKARFNLHMKIKDFAQGSERVSALGILDYPLLFVGLDPKAKPPQLKGRLTMSSMRLIPKEGMSNRLNLEILDEKGESIQKETIKIDEAATPPSDDASFVCELKKVNPGQIYRIKASMDLGAFLGPVRFEDTFVGPK